MLTTKQRKAVVMLFDGKKNREIAKELKVSEQSIYNWKHNSEFIAELKSLSDKYLGTEIPRILKHQIDLAFNARSEMVQFSATKDLLDRADFIPKNAGEEESDAQKASEKYDEIIKLAAQARANAETGAGAE